MIPDRSPFSHLSTNDQESYEIGISYVQQGLSQDETVLLIIAEASVA